MSASAQHPGRAVLHESVVRRLAAGNPLIHKGGYTLKGDAKPGDLVELVDRDGNDLGVATFNPLSHIPLRRIVEHRVAINQSFFESIFKAKLNERHAMNLESNAFRWIYAEGDGLPGLIVDSFDGHLSVQVRTLGMDRLRGAWLPALESLSATKSVFERSDFAGRKSEGMDARVEQLSGTTPRLVTIEEGSVQFQVDIARGLKTGHFLDQRETRLRVRQRVQPGQRVLDCFCFTGGFSLAAASAGAEATGLDMEPAAIQLARSNAELNGLNADFRQANVFEMMESGELRGPFDWIILDPPGIGKSRNTKNSLRGAIWKLVIGALPRLSVGGTVIVCVCTGQLSAEEALLTVQDAANECGAGLSLHEITFQDRDHPAPLGLPEALYLKCLWLRRLW